MKSPFSVCPWLCLKELHLSIGQNHPKPRMNIVASLLNQLMLKLPCLRRRWSHHARNTSVSMVSINGSQKNRSQSREDTYSSSGWWLGHPSEKYESQFGWLFPIYGKIKNVPNHQPVMDDNWGPLERWQLVKRILWLQRWASDTNAAGIERRIAVTFVGAWKGLFPEKMSRWKRKSWWIAVHPPKYGTVLGGSSHLVSGL